MERARRSLWAVPVPSRGAGPPGSPSLGRPFPHPREWSTGPPSRGAPLARPRPAPFPPGSPPRDAAVLGPWGRKGLIAKVCGARCQAGKEGTGGSGGRHRAEGTPVGVWPEEHPGAPNPRGAVAQNAPQNGEAWSDLLNGSRELPGEISWFFSVKSNGGTCRQRGHLVGGLSLGPGLPASHRVRLCAQAGPRAPEV